MVKVITELHYNWVPPIYDGQSLYSESSEKAIVGTDGVTEIKEHGAQGEGDRWFYDIRYESGLEVRVFNPNKVFFKPTT